MTAHLSRRTIAAKPSEVRKVFRAAQRPGMISFANGAPYLGALDFGRLAAHASDVLTDAGAVALQYGAGQGLERLREQICDLMTLEGITADADDVIVTTGSQQALDLAVRVLIDPGDVVFAEGPSYAGGMAVFTGFEAEIVHVDTDADGLIPEDLARKIAAVQAAGKTAKALYTIPTFQNPGGTTLTPQRRAEVGRICREQGVLIFEDDPYGLLGFDGATTRAIAPDFPDITLFFGSFSKMFAPGLRLGWLLAPRELVSHLNNANESTILNPSVYNQMLLSAYLEGDHWKTTLDEYRALYAAKCDAMLAALVEALPEGSTWNRPTGGFYIWVTVPERFDTEALAYECIDRGVVYVPGCAFFTDRSGHHELRLSFCLPTIEQIREGIAILGEVFAAADARLGARATTALV